MDETPVYMDMLPRNTVNMKGQKQVIIKSTGHEKSRYTVVLTVMADGTKLPPMIIFKRKTKPPGNYKNYDRNLYIIICVIEFIICYAILYSTCINIQISYV